MPKFLLLCAAFIFALATAYAVKERLHASGIRDPQAAEAAPITAKRVMVAKANIATGTFVRAERDLEWKEWPESGMNATYIIEGAQTPQDFEGAIARADINAGEPIIATRLVKTGDGGFLPAVFGAGMRAVTLGVSVTSGNAGFVFPGDRVDLIVTHTLDKEAAIETGVVSETFVRDVRVLAVDQRYANPENKVELFKTVTLEVSPKQAEMVAVAGELGKVSLSLRSLGKPEDVVKADAETVTRDRDVSQTIQVNKAAAPPMWKVSVSRGAETKDVEVPLSEVR